MHIEAHTFTHVTTQTELNMKPATHTNMWPFLHLVLTVGFGTRIASHLVDELEFEFKLKYIQPTGSWIGMAWSGIYWISVQRNEWHPGFFFFYPDPSVCEAFKTFKKILLHPLRLYEFYWILISLFKFFQFIFHYFKAPVRFSRRSPSIKVFLLKSNF